MASHYIEMLKRDTDADESECATNNENMLCINEYIVNKILCQLPLQPTLFIANHLYQEGHIKTYFHYNGYGQRFTSDEVKYYIPRLFVKIDGKPQHEMNIMANKPILETFKDTKDGQHMMFHQQTMTSPIDTTDRNQQMSMAEQLSVAQNDFDVPLNKSKKYAIKHHLANKVLRQIQSGYDKRDLR
eukprot:246924_1